LVMLAPIAMGAAHGGLVMKMRFGFIAGCVISGLMWLYAGLSALAGFVLFESWSW